MVKIGDEHMDIKQLKYFMAIAEEEQITGAAKKLHIAQPPLSYQLKILESELGVKLVERGSRKVKLTEAGRMLRNRAEQILELTETAEKELKDFKRGIQGTLSIGTVSSSGTSLLPERLNNFHKLYPDIKFEVWEGNTYKILEMLNHGLIEIGIVRTPFNIENYEAICLEAEPMVAVVSNSSEFIFKKENISLKELKNKPLIIYRRFEKQIINACHNRGFEPEIFCKNEDARTTLLWAANTLGIAIVPKTAVKLIGNTNLKYAEIDEAGLKTQIAAICMKNRYVSSAAQKFLQNFRLK